VGNEWERVAYPERCIVLKPLELARAASDLSAFVSGHGKRNRHGPWDRPAEVAGRTWKSGGRTN
jgi:hypothetical protein